VRWCGDSAGLVRPRWFHGLLSFPAFPSSFPPGRPPGINSTRVRNARLAAQEAAEQATPAGAASTTAGRGGGGAGAPPLLPVSAMEPTAGWSRAEAATREAERRDEAVSEYLRQINWWFLVCFVLSSVWVSNGGTCVRLVGGHGALAVSVLRWAFLGTCRCASLGDNPALAARLGRAGRNNGLVLSSACALVQGGTRLEAQAERLARSVASAAMSPTHTRSHVHSPSTTCLDACIGTSCIHPPDRPKRPPISIA